jgi:hypothetical protein
VQQMSSTSFSDVSRFGSDSGFPELLVEGASCIESGTAERKFMGGLWAVQTKIRTIRVGLSNLGILCTWRKAA